MIIVPDKQAIIDRPVLLTRLDKVAGEQGGPGAERAVILSELKTALSSGRAEIRRRFEAGARGTETVVAGAHLIDQIIKLLYDLAFERAYPLANPTAGERMTVVAVGGYGRRELAPESDIDLLFLYQYKATPHTEQAVEYILYALWDMGLKVGHAMRSINDCIRLSLADHTIRTGILEARYVCGDRHLFGALHRRFWTDVVAGTHMEFVEAKLAERDRRHRRMGDSRYVMEPNIKDGKGGLRDLHSLFWIARYLYQVDEISELVRFGVLTGEEAARFAKAQNLLWTLRCHLHYLTGRPGDRLTFDVQTEIGCRMGYTDHVGTRAVERFMKHYFLTAKTVGDLTRIFCAALKIEHGRKRRLRPLRIDEEAIGGFALEGGWLTVTGSDVFDASPINLLRLFHIAHEHDLDIHPNALKLVTRKLRLIDEKLRDDPDANRLFLAMLTSPKGPEPTLRRLNEAGVFGRFIPDFGRVVAQTQHDMYHVYTVDEHTIRAIGILSGIEQGLLTDAHPLASEIIHKVLSRRVLYVAALLHDIAKGRGGNHPAIGAAIARQLGPRLGLTDEETDNVAWVVLNHLQLSEVAFKRDLSDPKTIEDFVGFVQSPERLRLLLVMTVADIRAVGPTVWNNWKAAILRELYYRTEELMSGGMATMPAATRVAEAQAALRGKLADWTEDDWAALVVRLESSSWLSLDIDTLVRHARLLHGTGGGEQSLGISIEVDRGRSITEVCICTADRRGLFAQLAGAIAVGGANIVDARILTTADGMAVDTFWVQQRPQLRTSVGGAFDDPGRIARLRETIRRCLVGELDPARELARRQVFSARARIFQVAPRVLMDERASATHTVIEVNGRDRPGLLYALTRTITELDLQISSAKISTYGAQVVDAFYVKDLYGLKVTHPAKLDAIRTRLFEALEEPDGSAPTSTMGAAPRTPNVTTSDGSVEIAAAG